MNCPDSNLSSVSFSIEYRVIKNGSRPKRTRLHTAVLTKRLIHEPHRITYVLPSSIVSYAILQPPRSQFNNETRANHSLPILVALHGAGLQADSDQVRYMLDQAGDIPAWILFPSGVTSWSGDDWRKSILSV